ncbi:hypothetical protein [Pedobacter jeongneungensis]
MIKVISLIFPHLAVPAQFYRAFKTFLRVDGFIWQYQTKYCRQLA